MADFSIRPAGFDGAFCTVDTFRHLLTEDQAVAHLISVARHLRKDAVYVLGMHLLPVQGVTTRKVQWKNARGRLVVKTTMSVQEVNHRRREESIRMTLKINTPGYTRKYHSDYKLRTYTLQQFYQLLRHAGVFEISECYDQTYDISHPHSPGENSEDVVFLLRKI